MQLDPIPPAAVHPDVLPLLARLRDATLSPQMVLMYWLKLGQSVEQIESGLALLGKSSAPEDAGPVADLQAMLASNRAGCVRIASMLASGVDSDLPARTVEEGIAFCKRLFDWSSQQSSEASVALYSLGSPALLATATREIVLWLEQHGLLGSQYDALEIGCGTGRFEEALSPKLRSITGIDLSPEMLRQARERCLGLPNVSLQICGGRDLAGFDDASFDLVLAVDSFPYLFQAGRPLIARHFDEAGRVLRPGGTLVVLELSYGRTREADRSDFAAFAGAARMDVVVEGEQPFRAWDGVAFMARKGVPAG